MIITKESMKFHQIDKAMEYIVENNFVYEIMEDLTYTKPQPVQLLGVIEFGVGRAQSLRKICEYIEDNNLKLYVMGYDSWEGLIKETEGIPLFPKYTEGSYRFDEIEALYARNYYDRVFLRKCTFDNIPNEDSYMIKAAVLIHIDSDIYLSGKQALTWCFENGLVVKNTLIAYDEFDTVGETGGERLAHAEVTEKYKVKTKEVWSNLYTDKDTKTDVIQKVFQVISIGD